MWHATYGVPTEVHCSAGIAPGTIFFDTEPSFPQQYKCFALFLDWGNALVLKKVDKNGEDFQRIAGTGDEWQRVGRTGDEYQRIGIARFIWTPSQRAEEYGKGTHNMTFHRGVQCHGPITDGDEKVEVTFI